MRKFAPVRASLTRAGIDKPAIDALESLYQSGQDTSSGLEERVTTAEADIDAIEAVNATQNTDIDALQAAVAAMAAATVTVVASEALTAGLVNIFDDSGTASARMANATGDTRPASGFIKVSVVAGEDVEVHLSGSSSPTGVAAGKLWLATTDGAVSATAPSASGNLVQRVGTGTADELWFDRGEGVTLR